MSDFRLRVFGAVAWPLRFTKAAQELGISQPAEISLTLPNSRQHNSWLFFITFPGNFSGS
jgi:hypothetical protein